MNIVPGFWPAKKRKPKRVMLDRETCPHKRWGNAAAGRERCKACGKTRNKQ